MIESHYTAVDENIEQIHVCTAKKSLFIGHFERPLINFTFY
jgi:hypothetical protein